MAKTVDIEAAEHRQQDLYFNELFQLKVACEYMRRYRNRLSRWVRGFAAFRAIASSGAIATWAIVREYPLVWGGIIAAAQVSDVLKDVFPFAARQKAAADLAMALEGLLIEALYEWEGVFAGQLTDEEITERRRRLMQVRHNAEMKHFPAGDLPEPPDLLKLAESDAVTYFENMFRPGS